VGGVRRPVIAFFLALACVGSVAASRGVAATGPLSGGDDLTWAIDLERKIADHLWNGQIYEVDYHAGLEKTRQNIRSVNHYGDSALWTGTYLAAESFRYATAKKYIALLQNDPLKTEELAFWNAQKAESRQRVKQMVDKFRVLINISENWNHELDPNLEDPNFGGGVLPGEAGYLMRACIPAGTPQAYRWSNAELGLGANGQPANPPYTNHPRVFGPLPWPSADSPNRVDYFCENGTSRDAYAGTTFGLMTAFDLVSIDDPAMRRQLRDDMVTLTDFAVRYLWTTPRPHGRISLPIPLLEDFEECTFCGHDFENFISPLFIQVPLARLNMANMARHVTEKAPGRPDATKWQAVYAEEVATTLPMLAGSMEFDAAQPNESYYKFNLHHLTLYNTIRTTANAAVRAEMLRSLGVMDRTTGDDLNAHFETITYSVSKESKRLTAAISHLRHWRVYRTRIDTGSPVYNQKYCSSIHPGSGKVQQCVPEDQMEILPSKVCGGADAIVIPGSSTTKRARCPIAVGYRTPTDFLWQRPPNKLNGYEGNPLHQYPGIDYLLPYWMLRYHTEVVVPPNTPIPSHPGPAYS
jgi:hypothetical protein